MKLVAIFDKDRTKYGVLTFVGTGAPIAWTAFGKSDNANAVAQNNPTRDPIKIGGDLPSGSYNVVVGEILTPHRTYGPNAVLRLDPQAGQAITAKRNGRTGLLIHGGEVRANTGHLRPTYGCLRVSNEDMVDLLGIITEEGPRAKHTLTVFEV